MPCVAVIQYGFLEGLPPVMSLLVSLKQMGRNVHYIGRESEAAKRFLQTQGIPYTFIPYPKRGFGYRLRRGLTFFARRKFLRKTLEGLEQQYGKVTLWFQEVHSAALLGSGYKRSLCRIVTFFEFESIYGCRWLGFNLERMYRENVIVECEINRAFLTQAVRGLKELPIVIPNKPMLDIDNLPPLTLEARAAFDKIGSRPLFLYQGFLTPDRKDIAFILETIAKNRPNYCVLSMPGNPDIEARFSKYENAFTLPRISAPGHLSVTKRATVGVAVYNGTGRGNWYVNAMYCAPNKIYEYAAFGHPTLGNKIPGLMYSIEKAGAGICCDITEESVLAAADRLVENRAEYEKNARRFFNEADITVPIRAALQRAEKSCR